MRSRVAPLRAMVVRAVPVKDGFWLIANVPARAEESAARCSSRLARP
jgi:hypothetical protein